MGSGTIYQKAEDFIRKLEQPQIAAEQQTTSTTTLNETTTITMSQGRLGWHSYPPGEAMPLGTDVAHHEIAPCDGAIMDVQVIAKGPPTTTAEWDIQHDPFDGATIDYGDEFATIFENRPTMAAGKRRSVGATVVMNSFRKDDRFRLDVISGDATDVEVVIVYRPTSS